MGKTGGSVNLKRKTHLGSLGVDGRIIIQTVLKKCELDSSSLGFGPVAVMKFRVS